MNSDAQDQYGCSERYAELCALSTTSELSSEESAELQHHVATCAPCASLLREYTSLAHVGMAKLAPELEPEDQSFSPYHEKKAEQRLIAALHAAPSNGHPGSHSPIPMPIRVGGWKRGRRAGFKIAAAATVLFSLGSAYELGRRFETRPAKAAVPVAVMRPPAAALDTEKLALQKELAATQKSLSEITARTTEAEKQIAELSSAKASLLAQTDALTEKDQTAAESLVAVTQQRDSLQQQVNDTSKSLEQVKQDLNQARQDRQGAVLRIASLEEEVNNLHAAAEITDKSANNDEQFLARDRDIRELMGARQLYIADVFDVQHDGQRSKPFGRVFYTKGKSLIFYAFDLQAQPGYREAKAFQAWGKPDNPSGKPVSLGIFYMDNESNRRWVVKSDNPDVLAQINAVFVTVEPQGGSSKPTGKPFLEAYLHSLPPNHP